MKPLNTYIATLKMPVGIETGIVEAESMPDVGIFLADEYPHAEVISIVKIPDKKL